MNKKQYKTYLRQRLNEEDINHNVHNVIAQYGSQDPVPRLLARPDLSPDSQEVIAKNGTEEPSDDRQIASHPHGALTGVLARHLGIDASDVFETTSALTADSRQEHVDRAMAAVIYKHGDRLFNKLSSNRRSPYYTPYSGDEGRYQDDSEKAHDRFVADLSDHIYNNTSTGKHTEFKGTPPYDGVDEVI